MKILVRLFSVLLTIVFLTGSSVPSSDIKIKIGVFTSLRLKKIIINHNRGNYTVYGDGKLISSLGDGQYAQVISEGSSFNLSINGTTKGSFKSLRFSGKDYANNLKIKSIVPASRIRIYEDDLIIRHKGGKFQLINEPELNHYIAGVVESEVGKNAHLEYYKLQSILCRTYGLSNLRKHEDEDFNLCDRVHCQVYNGKSISNRDILKATAATNGLVVIDNNLELITATFHSNCGGHTVNSEDVWSLPLEYLRGVKDTFCLAEPHAEWRKTVSLKDWKSYLKRRFQFPIDNNEYHSWITGYEQPERDVFYTPENIPLKTVRKDWGLNSTYFSIVQHSDSITFVGKGFGHGVGLCQEGAMRMAQFDHSYKSILNQYYKNVNLVNLRALQFIVEE